MCRSWAGNCLLARPRALQSAGTSSRKPRSVAMDVGGCGRRRQVVHAALVARRRARLALELEGGVGDAEPVAHRSLHPLADGLCLLEGGMALDDDVGGEGADVRAQAPGMHVVHALDALDVIDRPGELPEVEALR